MMMVKKKKNNNNKEEQQQRRVGRSELARFHSSTTTQRSCTALVTTHDCRAWDMCARRVPRLVNTLSVCSTSHMSFPGINSSSRMPWRSCETSKQKHKQVTCLHECTER